MQNSKKFRLITFTSFDFRGVSAIFVLFLKTRIRRDLARVGETWSKQGHYCYDDDDNASQEAYVLHDDVVKGLEDPTVESQGSRSLRYQFKDI